MHVLVISRNYPNRVFPHLGLWVQRQTAELAKTCRMTVFAPIPYCPPGPLPAGFAKFRRIEAMRLDGDIAVHYPRFLVGPGNTTYAFDARSYVLGMRRKLAAVHADTPVDLVHAHFTYPEGAAALALGRRLGVPVVVTEHNLWRPWMDELPRVRRQALRAIDRAAAVVAVSRAAHMNMEAVARRSIPARIVPIGVDGATFAQKLVADGSANRLLYVGWLNRIKGVDVLLRALALLAERRPEVRLTLIGGSAYRNANRREQSIHDLVAELCLGSHVEFLGPRPEADVARAMREADVLVVPSRRESCGSVILEALASGTPVVTTRSGGPEDIVNDDVGRVVQSDNPAALAAAIEQVLAERSHYEPARLRDYALGRYSWSRLAAQYLAIYRHAIAGDADAIAAPQAVT